jgi:hypothetical protein
MKETSMGLFSKITNNFNHQSGVTVQVQAPNPVAANALLPVTVTIASTSAQTITGIKVEVKKEAKDESSSMLGLSKIEGLTAHDVAQVETHDSFTLGANETKTLQLQVQLNIHDMSTANTANSAKRSLTDIAEIGGSLGGVMEMAGRATIHAENLSPTYAVYVHVQVTGSSSDASGMQTIQILPPTQQPVPSAAPVQATLPASPTVPQPLPTATPIPQSIPPQPAATTVPPESPTTTQ